MLFELFNLNESSQSTALCVSICDLILNFVLAAVMLGFGISILDYYTDVTAMHVSRLILVEAILSFIFLPFAVLLVVSIKKDKHAWIRIWIKAKVMQAVYLFLLNFVVEVYAIVNLNLLDGLYVFLYTIFREVIYVEMIVYMGNYCKHQTEDVEAAKLPEKSIPPSPGEKF